MVAVWYVKYVVGNKMLYSVQLDIYITLMSRHCYVVMTWP